MGACERRRRLGANRLWAPLRQARSWRLASLTVASAEKGSKRRALTTKLAFFCVAEVLVRRNRQHGLLVRRHVIAFFVVRAAYSISAAGGCTGSLGSCWTCGQLTKTCPLASTCGNQCGPLDDVGAVSATTVGVRSASRHALGIATRSMRFGL